MAWSVPSWGAVSGGVLKALGYTFETPKQLPEGIASTSPSAGTFSVEASMSAFAAFPWVRACVNAIAEDISGLPLRLTKGEGESAREIHEHPVLDLLARPTADMTREEWERQLITYYLPSGMAYILILGDRQPVGLPLLHPELCRTMSDTYGQLAGIEFRPPQGGGAKHIAAESLAWVRASSWLPGDQAQVGEGLISSLRWELAAEQAAVKMAAAQAKIGRPNLVISPSEGTIPDIARKEIADKYAEFAASGKPAFVVGRGLKLDWPTYSPRDIEYIEGRKITRETVLAVFGVPPTRVGLPNANFATANAQARMYWTSLQSRARLIDGALTRIARRFGPGLSIAHDFSGVEALQESRTDRQTRVGVWIDMGATPAAAAAYEGFDDAPVPATTPKPTPPVAPPVKEPAKSITDLFVSPALVTRNAILIAPKGAEDRESYWRAWIRDIHSPQDVAFGRAATKLMRGRAERIRARASANEGRALAAPDIVTRDLVSDLMRLLYPEGEEEAQLRAALRPRLLASIMAGYEAGAGHVGAAWRMDDRKADILTDQALAELVAHESETTKAELRRIVLQGINEGDSVTEIGDRLAKSGAVSPTRGLLIARTEVTHSLTAGQMVAYQQADEDPGLSIRKTWCSARDRETRDAHLLLDGQTVALGAVFTIPSGPYAGATASGPGGFASAALVCNCRCCTIPDVEEV